MAATNPRPTISGHAAKLSGHDHCAECGDEFEPDETLRTEVVTVGTPAAPGGEHEQVRVVHPDCRGDGGNR